MVKLIIFDLDGVLVDTKSIHFNALNQALHEIYPSNQYSISETEHISIYDGLKTDQKLQLLTKNKGLPLESYSDIWNRKQHLTVKALSSLSLDSQKIELFKELKNMGYKLVCASNSIKKSVLTILSKIGVIEYIDLILSNDDVDNPKPHPEIYWNAMGKIGVLPEETLIIEDSPYGLLAAWRSKANILRITSPKNLVLSNIIHKLNSIKNKNMIVPKWVDNKLNVLIPMAGAGSRFESAGYSLPKPLIDINGKPMIKLVTDNLNLEANFIYIVQKSHREKYNLDILLNLISPNNTIIEVNNITEGAACTTLLAKNIINNSNPLIIANSDQFIEWNSNEFMYKMNETDVDGGIVTFTSTHPKWSFVKINEHNFVQEVAEKNPISNIATAGIYFWKHGSDYVKYAEEMINQNIRVNNEFYVCPVFNQAVKDNKNISIFNIEKMWGLGTPEDLNYYLENYTL